MDNYTAERLVTQLTRIADQLEASAAREVKEAAECYRCSGTGSYKLTYWDRGAGASKSIIRACHRCEGTGVASDD